MPFVLPSAPCIPPLGHHVQFIDSRSDLIGHAFRRCPLRTDERLPASPFLAQHGSAVVAGTIASTNSPGLSTARPSALRWRRHVQVVKEPRSSALLSRSSFASRGRKKATSLAAARTGSIGGLARSQAAQRLEPPSSDARFASLTAQPMERVDSDDARELPEARSVFAQDACVNEHPTESNPPKTFRLSAR